MKKSNLYAESEDGMIYQYIAFTNNGSYKIVTINYMNKSKSLLTQKNEYGMSTLVQAEKRLTKRASALGLTIKNKS